MRFVSLLLLGSLAYAEDQPHVNAGMEIGVGVDSTSIAARLHAGASHAFGDGLVRPSIGVGMTIGLGRDERENATDTWFADYGPVLQLGADIGDKQLVTNRVFASVGYANGWRLGVGGNLAQFAARAARQPGRGALLLVMPQQMEVTWSRDRIGVTFSYGI